MPELYPTDNDLNALSGTTDPGQGVPFPAVYESPYYTAFYKMVNAMLTATARAGDLRVYADGTLSVGVRAGAFFDGGTLRTIAAVEGVGIYDDATNSLYLDAAGQLQVVTTGFPDPATSPHLRLATVTTSNGAYDFDDVVDCRSAAMFALADNGRTIHVEATSVDNTDGSATVTCQVVDPSGANRAGRALLRTWISDTDFGAPSAVTDLTVSTGTEIATHAADADVDVLTDATGEAVLDVDLSASGTRYLMVSLGGHVTSETLSITL
jgi:hypothetical protein